METRARQLCERDDDTIRKSVNNTTKQSVVNAVLRYYKYMQINGVFPKYRTEEKIPFIPQEQELDQLISGCKHRLATFLQTLKDTACRYGEAYLLKWSDIDTEAMELRITPEKGSNPRRAKISAKLLGMLLQLPRKNDSVFDYANKDVIRKNFQRARRRIVRNLNNPRIRQIHMHTFRHWKATTMFHATNNVLLVQKMLGHKSLSNTQRYIQLLPDMPENFVAEFAYTKEDDKRLIEAGYEFHAKRDNVNIYRKRK